MRWSLFLALGFLAGCGGSGGGGGTTPPPTDLTGTWSGNWDGGAVPPPGTEGTLTVTVEADGDLTGTVFNQGKNETGQISGTIQPNGYFDFVIDYPSIDCEVNGRMLASGPQMVNTWHLGSEEQTRTIYRYLFHVQLIKQ